MNNQAGNSLNIGVVVVTFNAAGFVGDCLESLFAAGYLGLKVVVVDNASPDDSMGAVQRWAAGEWQPEAAWPFAPDYRAPRPVGFAQHGPEGPRPGVLPQLTLIQSGANLGFAGGVNVGLRALLADPAIDLFWILNPDTVIEPEAPAAFARKVQSMGRFGLIGGRVLYLENPDIVQIDGGTLHPLGGHATGINVNAPLATAPLPRDEDIVFVSGASMVASRAFIERAGLIDESYFLYFEEIDWQLRRGDLPIGFAADARVLHRAGASIGSAGLTQRPSALSLYFTSRNLMRFVRRWSPAKLPAAYALSYWRLLRRSDGSRAQVTALLCGIHGMGPPPAVRAKLSNETWKRIAEKRVSNDQNRI